MKIVKSSPRGLQLCEDSEGLRLIAYLDGAKVPTIGIGTTRYPSGVRVALGDTCNKQQAYEWLAIDHAHADAAVDAMTRDDISQNQFDALSDFVYNLGVGAYQNSTLRKLINANLNDQAIRAEFMKWVHAGGEIENGLIKRRKAEADLYFS